MKNEDVIPTCYRPRSADAAESAATGGTTGGSAPAGHVPGSAPRTSCSIYRGHNGNRNKQLEFTNNLLTDMAKEDINFLSIR